MLEALHPWPLEEALFRPVVSILLALLVPLATERVIGVVAGAADREIALRVGLGVSAALESILAFLLGATSVGPAWQARPWGSAAIALGLACALTVSVMHLVAWRRRAVGAKDATAAPASASAARVGVSTSVGIAVVLVVLGWLALDVTRLADDEAELVSVDETWRRLRVEPWDASATLALGWQARRREDLERAAAYAAEAERMGVATPALLELRAELLAARGDCEAARATFDEALAARVVDPLAVSLELGGYRIPPTLLTECGMGETEP